MYFHNSRYYCMKQHRHYSVILHHFHRCQFQTSNTCRCLLLWYFSAWCQIGWWMFVNTAGQDVTVSLSSIRSSPITKRSASIEKHDESPSAATSLDMKDGAVLSTLYRSAWAIGLLSIMVMYRTSFPSLESFHSPVA